MRKIKELLRLHSLGLKQHQIAAGCEIAQSTVSAHLHAAEDAGIRWPDIADWDESRLQQALYPTAPAKPNPTRNPTPDFAAIHQELQTNKHVTLHRKRPVNTSSQLVDA